MVLKDPYGFVYITTNMVNGRKYIGQKKFQRDWKSYLGSGKILKQAVELYGRDSFERDIIAIAYSKEELDVIEKEHILNHGAIGNSSYYNIACGGRMGGDLVSGLPLEEKKRIAEKIRIANYKSWTPDRRATHSLRMKNDKNPFYGKSHSDACKQIMSEKRKGKGTGSDNPFFGREHTPQAVEQIKESNSTRVIVYDIFSGETTLIRGIKNVSQALSEAKLSSPGRQVQKIIDKRKLFHNRYLIFREETFKELNLEEPLKIEDRGFIEAIGSDGKVIKFGTIKECSAYFGVYDSYVGKCIRDNKLFRGYKLRWNNLVEVRKQ